MFSVEDVLDWDIPLKGPLYEDLRPLYDYQCAVERKMRRAERLKLKKMGANNMNVYRDDSDTGSEGNDNDYHMDNDPVFDDDNNYFAEGDNDDSMPHTDEPPLFESTSLTANFDKAAAEDYEELCRSHVVRIIDEIQTTSWS